MNRIGAVWMKERLAGKVWQDEPGNHILWAEKLWKKGR